MNGGLFDSFDVNRSHFAGIAQVVEQKTENLCVVGSTPSPGTSHLRSKCLAGQFLKSFYVKNLQQTFFKALRPNIEHFFKYDKLFTRTSVKLESFMTVSKNRVSNV